MIIYLFVSVHLPCLCVCEIVYSEVSGCVCKRIALVPVSNAFHEILLLCMRVIGERA